MKLPIAIIAYNRPDYLFKLLLSIQPQIEGRRVYVFLDGEKNSGDKTKVDAGEKVCRELIPSANLLRQPQNLGIAFHTDFARNYMLNTLNYEAAIFLEDDVVLNHYYFELLDHLYETAGQDGRVAMISAFGDHDAPKKEQDLHKKDFVVAPHVWAYLLKKEAYNKALEIFKNYLNLLPKDYAQILTVQNSIFRWQKSIGAKRGYANQDYSFLAALTAKNLLSIATFTNNLKYIGATGEHYNPQTYHSAGYDRWHLWEKMEKDFIWNDEVFSKLLGEQKQRYAAEFEDDYTRQKFLEQDTKEAAHLAALQLRRFRSSRRLPAPFRPAAAPSKGLLYSGKKWTQKRKVEAKAPPPVQRQEAKAAGPAAQDGAIKLHSFLGSDFPPDDPDLEIFVVRFKYQQYTEIEAMSARDALNMHKSNHHLIYWFYPADNHKALMEAAGKKYSRAL